MSAVEGGGVGAATPDPRPLPSVTELAGGDVVGFRARPATDVVCGEAAGPSVLVFGVAGRVEAALSLCGLDIAFGPGRPWYGDRDGPLSAFVGGALDVDAALSALDPFGGGAG